VISETDASGNLADVDVDNKKLENMADAKVNASRVGGEITMIVEDPISHKTSKYTQKIEAPAAEPAPTEGK
jgi:hypothetical protein